jgi:hypothetical protein
MGKVFLGWALLYDWRGGEENIQKSVFSLAMHRICTKAVVVKNSERRGIVYTKAIVKNTPTTIENSRKQFKKSCAYFL